LILIDRLLSVLEASSACCPCGLSQWSDVIERADARVVIAAAVKADSATVTVQSIHGIIVAAMLTVAVL
jgi:hypothetical protein